MSADKKRKRRAEQRVRRLQRAGADAGRLCSPAACITAFSFDFVVNSRGADRSTSLSSSQPAREAVQRCCSSQSSIVEPVRLCVRGETQVLPASPASRAPRGRRQVDSRLKSSNPSPTTPHRNAPVAACLTFLQSLAHTYAPPSAPGITHFSSSLEGQGQSAGEAAQEKSGQMYWAQETVTAMKVNTQLWRPLETRSAPLEAPGRESGRRD